MAERDAEGLTFVNGAVRQWGNEAMDLGFAETSTLSYADWRFCSLASSPLQLLNDLNALRVMGFA